MILLLLSAAALAAIYVVNFRVASYSNDRLKTIEGLSVEPSVGIVFGARDSEAAEQLLVHRGRFVWSRQELLAVENRVCARVEAQRLLRIGEAGTTGRLGALFSSPFT